MPIRKVESIRKRDGRSVAYDEQKIAEAIGKAARSAGHDNATIGRDLASVVTMYLEKYRERELPTSEEIQQLVEKILFDTGHPAIARAYIVHRERKGRLSEASAPPAEDLFPSNLLLVEGATRGEVAPWGREKIIAALTKEAGLEEPAAAEIAGAVEQKIFRLGQRRVSTSLIRELVNHELLGRGYGSKLRRQIVVGLPKYDLGRLVGDEDSKVDPDALCRVIGQTTLKQYALQEIFPRDVGDAHLEGRLHVHALEDPLKLFSVSVPLAGIRRTGVPVRGSVALSEPARDARTLTAQLAHLLSESRRFVSLAPSFPGLSEAYDQLLWGADEDRLVSEMEHLAAVLGDSEAEVDPRHRTALPLARRGRALVLVEAPGDGLKEFSRAAVERGLLFALGRPGSPAGSGARGDGWRGVAQAITINLPQAFYRSEAGSEFYAELETSIALAVKAQLQKRQLVRGLAERTGGAFGQGFCEAAGDGRAPESLDYAVGLAGLNEVVQLLSGEELLGGDGAVRLALRLVSYVYFRLQEESARHGLRLALQDPPGAEAADRFSRIDAQMYPRARGLLADRAAYTPGFRTRGRSSFESLSVESRFHTLVPSARAVAERARLSPAELLAVLGRLHAETLATRLSVE